MSSLYSHLGLLALRLYMAVVARERRESGQAVLEYAMILAFIMIAILTATRFLGTKASGVFSKVANSI